MFSCWQVCQFLVRHVECYGRCESILSKHKEPKSTSFIIFCKPSSWCIARAVPQRQRRNDVCSPHKITHSHWTVATILNPFSQECSQLQLLNRGRCPVAAGQVLCRRSNVTLYLDTLRPAYTHIVNHKSSLGKRTKLCNSNFNICIKCNWTCSRSWEWRLQETCKKVQCIIPEEEEVEGCDPLMR